MRLIWDLKQIFSETHWMLTKTNDQKDKNPDIRQHNMRIKKKNISILKRCEERSMKLDKFDCIILRDVVDVFLTKPHLIGYVVDRLHREALFAHLEGPIALVLGFISLCKCLKCANTVDIKYTTSHGSQYYCVNNDCDKTAWSVWPQSSIRPHFRFYEYLKFLFLQAGGDLQKNWQFSLNKRESEISRDFMASFLNCVCIYESMFRIKTGGEENDERIKSCIDHKVCGGKRKYGKGDNRVKKIKIQGAHDSRSIVALDIVANERKPQVHHMTKLQAHVKTYVSTDQAPVFKSVVEIESKKYAHGSCKHSGMFDKKTARLNHFTNPETGDDSNGIEHTFGKFGQKISFKGQMMRNFNLFKGRMKQYVCVTNRTSNYQPQVFMLSCDIITTTKPPNKPDITIEAEPDFSDKYVVDYIFDERSIDENTTMYRVKFKNMNWDHAQWVNVIDFDDKQFVNEYSVLSSTEKKKILEKAKKLILKHVNKCKSHQCIAGLNEHYIQNLCVNSSIYEKGMKMFRNLSVAKSIIKGTGSCSVGGELVSVKHVTAEIKSQTIIGKSWNAIFKYNVNSGEIYDYACECPGFQNEMATASDEDGISFCKHLVCSAINRIVSFK
eukprot:432273_1